MVKKNKHTRELDDDVQKAYQKWEDERLKSISNQIVEYFPQAMIFHTIIVSMAAIRAPTDFAAALVLFAMLMRIIIVFGYYCNKKIIYIGGGAMEVFINFMLLFVAMVYN